MPTFTTPNIVALQDKYRRAADDASKAAAAAAEAHDQAELTGSLVAKHRALLADAEAARTQRAADAAFNAVSKNFALTDC